MPRGRLPYAETSPVDLSESCHWQRHGLPLACRRFQQVAGAHATALGVGLDALVPQGLSWVLAAIRLRWEQPLRAAPATITIETGPRGAVSRLAFRDLAVYADAEEDPCLLGSSRWLMVRTDSGRPIPLPPAVRDLVPVPLPPCLEIPARLPPVTHATSEHAFSVRRYDLDLNRHANNARLVEMVAESVPQAVWEEGRLDDLTVLFRQGARVGDSLCARTQTQATAQGWDLLQSLVAAPDGREILQAQARWTRLPEADP